MAVSFIDGTFNLSDYSILTYQSGGATIQNEQILTGGDPGAAAETILTIPATDSFYSDIYWINNTFIYEPTTQGAIQSIDLSADRYVKWNVNFPTEGCGFVIKQGGKLFVDQVTVSADDGAYEKVSQTGATASDFDLITNAATGTTDSTQHPDFATGELQFGFRYGPTIGGNAAASVATEKTDNISFIIHGEGLPSISSLQPSAVDAGSAAFTLTVNGSNFVSGDTVEWNGVALATTFVSASKLTAKVAATEVAAAGSAAVTVVDNAAGDQTSKPALFAIPLTSLAITSQSIKNIAGGYSITLTLSNSGFNAATDVLLTGAYLATTNSSTALPIDIASIAARAGKTVTLAFPSSAGKAGEEVYLLLYGSYVGGAISLNSIETLP